MARLRPLQLLGFASLVASAPACSRLPPADLSAEHATAGPSVAGEPARSARSDCDLASFDACTNVCRDLDCLEWCAGSECAATATELFACAAPGEARFLAENPEPELIFVPPGPDAPAGQDYAEVDPASEERLYAWEDQRSAAMDEHWISQCMGRCQSVFGDQQAGEGELFCADLSLAVYEWKRFEKRPEPPKQRRERDERERRIAESSGILGSMAGIGALGAFGGSYVIVDSSSLARTDHRESIIALISASATARGAAECVDGLSEEGRVFSFTLSFDPDGTVREVAPKVAGEEATCVGELLGAGLWLPYRVAASVPPVVVEVHVHAESDWGSFGVGGLDADMGGLWGDEIGDAYGVGGLGLTGTGVGGGGSGELADDWDDDESSTGSIEMPDAAR